MSAALLIPHDWVSAAAAFVFFRNIHAYPLDDQCNQLRRLHVHDVRRNLLPQGKLTQHVIDPVS